MFLVRLPLRRYGFALISACLRPHFRIHVFRRCLDFVKTILDMYHIGTKNSRRKSDGRNLNVHQMPCLELFDFGSLFGILILTMNFEKDELSAAHRTLFLYSAVEITRWPINDLVDSISDLRRARTGAKIQPNPYLLTGMFRIYI